MLSRVADSLYWMSRYFERASHCARVLEANFNLMLNPGKLLTGQRWQNIVTHLGMGSVGAETEPQAAILRLMADGTNRSSIVSCISSARENAAQVREQISSEMWERLNQLYHEVTQSSIRLGSDGDLQRLFTAVREGSYKFAGVTEATMNQGEAWHFIQLGKYMERTFALSVFLDAIFSAAESADDLDWVGVLTSCAAFEAYCKVYTADLKPELVAEFLLLNPEFPLTIRYSTERIQVALDSITRASSVRTAQRIERIAGRLHSSLAYVQIGEIMAYDFHVFLRGIIEQCHNLQAAMHEAYVDYPIETALEA